MAISNVSFIYDPFKTYGSFKWTSNMAMTSLNLFGITNCNILFGISSVVNKLILFVIKIIQELKVFAFTIYVVHFFFSRNNCDPVGWGSRIHRLHLYRREKRLQWVFCFDTKQSNGEVPVMLELSEIQSIPSLPSLPGPFCPGVVAPDRVLSNGQIELFDIKNCVLEHLNWVQPMTYAKLNSLK